MRRTNSKAYAVLRGTLQGIEISYAERKRRVRGRSKFIRHRPGRFFYCQHCGKRLTATETVIQKGRNPNYISCGEHGEVIVESYRAKPGEFYR